MSLKPDSPTPWTNRTAPIVPAGSRQILFGGKPPLVDCRVLSEPNYQYAVECVNLRAEVEARYAPVVKAAREAIEWWLSVDETQLLIDGTALRLQALESALRDLELSEGRSKSK